MSTSEQLVMSAMIDLRAALGRLRAANATKTADRVRLALSSAKGALRNAHAKSVRATREDLVNRYVEKVGSGRKEKVQ